MSKDCPHDRCHFFLGPGTARCPACGRSPRVANVELVLTDHRIVAGLSVALATLFAALLLLGWWVVALLILVAVGAGSLTLWHQARNPGFTTLDARYGQAVAEASRWLEKWSELFTLNASVGDRPDDERRLTEEAKDAAADAAAAAIALRNDYASRYLVNAFDRMDYLSASRPASTSDRWEVQWNNALGIVEQYLDTLWVDQQVADSARSQLAALRSGHLDTRRRQGIIQLANTVRVFEESKSSDDAAALAIASADLTDDQIEAHRRRLRIERQLLRESPRPGGGNEQRRLPKA